MMHTDASLSLRLTDSGPRQRSPLRNFVLMSVFFSINHACVVSVLNLSVQLLGGAGSYQSGGRLPANRGIVGWVSAFDCPPHCALRRTQLPQPKPPPGALYIAYAVTALLVSAGLVDALGPRTSLLLGTALYSGYVLSLPIALIVPPEQRVLRVAVAIVGGVVGGFAAGFLWTAQGTYFTLSAARHAAAAGAELADANAALASYFASIFLGCAPVSAIYRRPRPPPGRARKEDIDIRASCGAKSGPTPRVVGSSGRLLLPYLSPQARIPTTNRPRIIQ